MTSKDIDRIDKRIDRLEDRIERLEIRLDQINLSEVIVKGREIENIYEKLNKIGIVDVFTVYNELLNIKQTLNKIIYHPWQWLERDPIARQSFFAMLNKKIVDEVRHAALFTIYEEQPKIVVKIIKDAVKEYLDVWEINDQVAKNIVSNVINDGYLSELSKNVLTLILPYVKEIVRRDIGKKLKDIKAKLESDG